MWYQSLLPTGIIFGTIVVANVGVRAVNYLNSGTGVGRYRVDDWDRLMAARDRKITGSEWKQQMVSM